MACWAATRFLIYIDAEFFLTEALFILAFISLGGRFVILEARVAGTEAGVGNIAIDLFGLQVLEHLAVVVAGVGGDFCFLQCALCFLVAVSEGVVDAFKHRFE